ncbi:MAG TPA: response regulator [Polyangia bacterium]|nr:response regulator [Polyangia bacterium]
MNQPLVTEVRLFEEEASLRVLLAEDDHSLRRLLAVILRRDGHEVVEVGDGAELLEAMAASLVDPRVPPFDLIVCEHRLPGLPGLSVLAGLRARDPATAFVLLTDSVDLQRRARELGAVALAAPLNVRAFQAAVRRATLQMASNDNALARGDA